MEKIITPENLQNRDKELVEFSRLWGMPFYDGFSDEQQLILRNLTYQREDFLQKHLDNYIKTCNEIITQIDGIKVRIACQETIENQSDDDYDDDDVDENENIEIVIWQFKENSNYLHEKLLEADNQFIERILNKIPCCLNVMRKYLTLSNEDRVKCKKQYDDFLLLFKTHIENKLNKLPETPEFRNKKLKFLKITENAEAWVQEILKHYTGERIYNLHSLQFEKNKLKLSRKPVESGLSKKFFKISFTPEQMTVRRNPNQIFNTIQSDLQRDARPNHKGRENSMEDGHYQATV